MKVNEKKKNQNKKERERSVHYLKNLSESFQKGRRNGKQRFFGRIKDG